MTNQIIVTTLSACFLLAFQCFSYASDSHHQHNTHEHGDHQHHVHGEAKLILVIEGNTLMIEFNSPAMDVLGFEGSVQSKDQQSVIAQVEAVLSAPSDMFGFDSKSCQVKTVETNLSSSHKLSDVTAQYHFKCKQGKTPTWFNTSIFERFQGLQQVKVQWITDYQQGAAVLSPSQTTVRLGGIE